VPCAGPNGVPLTVQQLNPSTVMQCPVNPISKKPVPLC
jgi:hypothetical protein